MGSLVGHKGIGTRGDLDGEGSADVAGIEGDDSDIKADGTDDPIAMVFGGGSLSALELSWLLLFLRALLAACIGGK